MLFRSYEILKKSGHDVLLDNRDLRAGIKFSEHEMLGIPFSIIIGPNNYNKNHYEFTVRSGNVKSELTIDEIKQKMEKFK